MQQAVELGTVVTRTVTACSLNLDEGCRARGVAVGDIHPRCDTNSQDSVRLPREEAGIAS